MNYYIGNWKMNMLTKSELQTFCEEFSSMLPKDSSKDFIGFASQAHQLPLLAQSFGASSIKAGSQNFYPELSGAFTGELSLDSLIEYGSEFTLIGHSERRQYFNESEDTCLEKLQYSLNKNVKSVFCFGETLSDFEGGKTKEVLEEQLSILTELDSKLFSNLILAYEPVWAIGTGKTATIEIIDEVSSFIRSHISTIHPDLKSSPLLYGGSVKPANIQGIMALNEVNGVLVGGASLKAQDFSQICSLANT